MCPKLIILTHKIKITHNLFSIFYKHSYYSLFSVTSGSACGRIEYGFFPDDIFGSVLVGDDVIGLDVLRSVGVDEGVLIFDIGRSILKNKNILQLKVLF